MCAAFPPAAAERAEWAWLLGDLKAHHVVLRQRLERAGLFELLWDERIGLCLCEWHHRRHHNRRQPVPTSLLRAETVALMHLTGFGWMLNNEREYP